MHYSKGHVIAQCSVRLQRSDKAMVMKQNFPHMVLEEKDVQVHRATGRHSSNTHVSLKRWLATRGLTTTRKKADLVGQVLFL